MRAKSGRTSAEASQRPAERREAVTGFQDRRMRLRCAGFMDSLTPEYGSAGSVEPKSEANLDPL
jgi:hypothetical protein